MTRNSYCFNALILFTIIHGISLPLVLSYDSQLYIDQALMLGDPRFWNDWHFLRTPLFQALTRVVFTIVGQNCAALLFVTTLLGFLGLVLMQRILKRWVLDSTAWLATFFVSAMPLLLTYQHTFLTEAGTFFMIGVIMLALLSCLSSGFSVRSCLFAGLSASIGFYFRPSLLVLSVVAPIAFFIFQRPRPLRQALNVIALTFLLPQILALPWKIIGSESDWEVDQIAFGIINQAILPVESLGTDDAKEKYAGALTRSLVNGSLSTSGIADGEIYPLLPIMRAQMRQSPSLFFVRTIISNPKQYCVGVIRGMALLMGLPGVDSDNTTFKNLVFLTGGSTILPGPARLEAYMTSHFARTSNPSPFSSIIRRVDCIYAWLYRLGALLLFPLLIFSILRKDSVLFVVTAIPAAFLTYHALILFSLDRMAVPVIPYIASIPLVLLAQPWCLCSRALKVDQDSNAHPFGSI